MYYYRVLSNEFAGLLEKGRELRWLFDFVVKHEELDIRIGKSKTKQWISVYYGLTRLFSIRRFKDSVIFIDASNAYKELPVTFYGRKSITDNFQEEIESLLVQLESKSKIDGYYENGKEGYHQNIFSRRYGICGNPDDEFVIIDKEAVIGYDNQAEKDAVFAIIQELYKNLRSEIYKQDQQRYGKDPDKKPHGNEPDFLALDKEGNILLIEFKNGADTSGIYLSPLQLGLYFEVFSALPGKQLESGVLQMLVQKQKIGLINPGWHNPESIKDIIPVLIISDYDDKSIAKAKFHEVLEMIRKKYDDSFLNTLQVFTFSLENGLTKW